MSDLPKLRVNVIGSMEIKVLLPTGEQRVNVAKADSPYMLMAFVASHGGRVTHNAVEAILLSREAAASAALISPHESAARLKQEIAFLHTTLAQELALQQHADSAKYLTDHNSLLELVPEYVSTDVGEFLQALEKAENCTALQEELSCLNAAIALFQKAALLHLHSWEWIPARREALQRHYEAAVNQRSLLLATPEEHTAGNANLTQAHLTSVPATIIFTDIEKSSAQWKEHGDSFFPVLMRHNALLRALLAKWGGQEIQDKGDGFVLLFPQPLQAIQFAVEAQRRLARETWSQYHPHLTELRVRMGIHTGQPLQEQAEGKTQYRGEAMNQAARVESFAQGGQILITNVTYEFIRGKRFENVACRDYVKHVFKGVEELWLYEVQLLDLPYRFEPPAPVRELLRVYPRMQQSFIGREQDVADIRQCLEKTPLVTITGAGGCGKTALAKQVVQTLEAEYLGDIVFAELAAFTEAERVLEHVLQTLQIRAEPGQILLDALCSGLQSRSTLLVLDNCEHLLEPCKHLIQQLLSHSCPNLRILATSRRSLKLFEGQEFPIEPFAVPDPDSLPPLEELRDREAIRLFVERAQTINRHFDITEANKTIIAQICRRLDGIPLAIEIVAAQTRTPLSDILDELNEVLLEPPEDGDKAEQRAQTVSNCIAWSYELLSPKEQMLFRRMSVFAGGCQSSQIKNVCAWGDLRATEIRPLRQVLLDASLLYAEAESDRYRLLEPIRLFGLARLMDCEEEQETRERQANELLTQTQEDPLAALMEPQDKIDHFLDDCRNLDELRAWMEAKQPAKSAEFASRSWAYRIAEGYILKALEVVKINARVVPNPNVQLQLYLGQAVVAFFQNDFEEAVRIGETGLAMAQELAQKDKTDFKVRKFQSMSHLGVGAARALALCPDTRPDVEEHLQQGVRMAIDLNDAWCLAFGHMCIGTHLWCIGRHSESTKEYREAYEGFKRCQDEQLTIYSLNSLAHLLRRGEDCGAAIPLYLESAGLSRKKKNKRGKAGCILGTAGVAIAVSRLEEAAYYYGAALLLYSKIGSSLIPPIANDYDADIRAVRQALGEATFQQAYARGFAGNVDAIDKTLAEAETFLTQTRERLSNPA